MHEGWAEGSEACSESQFKATIASEGVALKRVTTVPGFHPHLEQIEYWREPPQPMSFIVNFKC